MKEIRQNSFALILVIVAIALIGVVVFLLTEDANTLVFQSDMAYLEAVERNLITSGLAWAKQNIKNDSYDIFHKDIELDVTDLNIRVATLSVVIGTPKDNRVEVEVGTSCSRGRQTLRHQDKYKIRIFYESQTSKAQI